MTAHAKLMQARLKLQALPLKKSGANDFAKYKYFELGDFLPEVMRIFSEVGLCGIVSFSTDIATLTITDLEDGTCIVITSPMADANLKGSHPIQNLGAVQTYIRRYLWVTAMEIVEHDALDYPREEEPKPKTMEKLPPKAPPVMQGKPGEWQLVIKADPAVDFQVWIGVVMDAARVALNATASRKDVTDIFKVNRPIFDKLKAEAPEDYEFLMSEFKTRKESFKEA